MSLLKLSLITFTLIMSGCTLGPNKPFHTDSNGIRIHSSTSDLKSTYMKDHGSKEIMCAARQSDVADTKGGGVGIGVGAEKISDSVSQGAISLGGRNPSVLLAREILFRTCELSMNYSLTKKEAIKIFHDSLKTVNAFSKYQTGTGTESKVSAGSGAQQVNNNAGQEEQEEQVEQEAQVDKMGTAKEEENAAKKFNLKGN